VDAAADAGGRILVADDSSDMRTLVRLALESARVGRVVAEAADGDETRRLVVEARPDLVVLDLAMPRFDGLESLGHLRERVPGIRVVVHSGSAGAAFVEQARAAGALGYVVKGAPLHELVRTVQAALDAAAPG
jgi:DNA-binding NarL/FixJ family response regulator